MKKLLLLSILAIVGCQHPQKRTGAPQASTAAVGVNLNNLSQSLGKAQDSVTGIRKSLSEVDSKAVLIHEAIHRKRP